MEITWAWTLVFCAFSALVGIHIGLSNSVFDKIAKLEGKLRKKIQPYWYKDYKGVWHHIQFVENEIYIDGKKTGKLLNLQKNVWYKVLPFEGNVGEVKIEPLAKGE